MNANAIMNAAVKKMQSFVSVVSDENYDTFVERERATKHKILLFTEKKTTPTVFKALSKTYLNKLMFGEVKQAEEALIKKFNIESFPVIMALTDPENYGGEKYEGEMKIDQLTKFLGNYAYTTPKKPEMNDYVKLTEKKMKGVGANSLCGPKSSNICVIIFPDAEDDLSMHNQLNELKPALERFK